MGVTNIQDAKILILSSRVTDRTNGLKTLIHILRHNEGRPTLEALGNKEYGNLFETIFQCLRDDRSTYLKAKSRTSKTGALLPLSATALRYLVKTGVRTIKNNTVEVIIKSIAEVFFDRPDGAPIQPLVEDLPKALRVLLEYQPHVERLTQHCWDDAIDFCLASLSSFIAEPEIHDPAEDSWSTNASSRSHGRTPFDSTGLTIRSSARDLTSKAKAIPEDSVHAAEEFVHSVHLLTKASNAPLLGKADTILATLVRFLQRKSSRGNATAIAAINSILARITLDSIHLTKRTMQDLLPLLKSLWSDHLLRDEISMTLMHTEMHLLSILSGIDGNATSIDLEGLVEIMYSDYRRRQETSANQFLEEDHLCFRNIGPARAVTHPLHTYAFSMEVSHHRSEGLWAIVAMIARFSFMIDRRKRSRSPDHSDGEEVFIKRRRITHNFQEYLRHVSEPRSNAKRAALQVIAFMLQEGPFDGEDIQATLDKLTAFIADENPVHSSWAMIALTAAAFQKSATDPSLLPLWINVWQSASRVITSLSSSRAACHLMHVLLTLKIVPFSAVSETVQSLLLSIELSGPALLTDASSSLMATIVRERVIENPAHYSQTAERASSWLLSKWTPGSWSERTYSSQNGHHCIPHDVLQVVHACLDRPFSPIGVSAFRVLGGIAQTQIQTSMRRDLERYLLLLEGEDEFRNPPIPLSSSPELEAGDYLTSPLGVKFIEFCITEHDRLKDHWKELSQTSPQSITPDMLRIITGLCIIGPAISSFGEPTDRRVRNLESAIDSFAQIFVNFLTRRDVEQYKIDAVLEICTRSLPDVSNLADLSVSAFKTAGVLFLSYHLSKALSERKEVKQSFHADDDDLMEIEDPHNSQLTRAIIDPDSEVPRHDLQACNDIAALRASCLTYFHLIAAIQDGSNEDVMQIPPDFMEYLVSLHEADLLRSRQFLHNLLLSRFHLPTSSYGAILERLSDDLIDPRAREYNTSEIANGMVVDVLTSAIRDYNPASLDKDSQEVCGYLEALYSYYVKEMEKGGTRRSPGLQRSITDFLHGLIKHQPDFGQNLKSPSVRTSLFELLSSGEIIIKTHVAECLATIFEGFVLSEHDKILQDVYSSLPSDAEWTEGIAVTLLVLSKLASRWHTLLRQSVYRIFATAGSVDDAALHAKHCLKDIAKAKGLGTPQALFQLFAPQIIYTWLDRKKKFMELPYLAFDYPNLADLIRDIESEAVGQAMMLGLQEEVEFLAEQLGSSTAQILTRNFAKAASYTLSWDTCKGYARNKADSSNAMLLRDLIGSEAYGSAIHDQFPRVLGHILQTMNHEERITKALEKRPAYSSATKALAEIDKFGHSSLDFDLGIEPSFSAFYLFDQIERLCRRLSADPVSFWNPSTYTFCMRMLLDRIHPALGPLHARSIIRKIKILVALAGQTAYEGYPLQMTLQSLRPFLTDIQCAEDTLGIMQYLFEHGYQYLLGHLSFMTGIGLSILISIRVFLGSSQESTTQQSQHTATMTKATRFHSWLTTYLESYAKSIDNGRSSSSIKAFRQIITAASRIRIEGNSVRGSEESKLLLAILDDISSERKLLNRTSREVALDLLCQNFQPAPTPRDDVLSTDPEVVEYASQVWESCQRTNIGDGYLLWAARVLGRTFGACGEVKRGTNISHPWSMQHRSSKDALGQNSREAIVRAVVELFYSDDRKSVGLAEDAVRLLISRLSDSSYLTELENTIPNRIGQALGRNIPSEPGTQKRKTPQPLKQAALPAHEKPVSLWIRDLATSLCEVASDDPILGSLSILLLEIDQMAEQLFPYILHLVLLEQYDGDRSVRETMSRAVRSWFDRDSAEDCAYNRILIEAILYLRSQRVPKETTRVDRDQWLEVDFLKAAHTATCCGMFRSALLFGETSSGQPIVKSSSRRSSVLMDPPKIPVDLQLSIYRNLDEPDSFYGVEHGFNLSSVVNQLDYEDAGVKSLLFRGARLDSQIRRSNTMETADSRGMVKSLISLNMNSITHSLLSNDKFRDLGDDAVDSTLHTARKLGQWDIKAPEGNHTESGTLFKAFQSLHSATDVVDARSQLDRQLLATMNFLSGRKSSSIPLKTRLRTLAVLAEADEVLSTTRQEELLDFGDQIKAREKWMRAGEYDDVRLLLSCRETLFGVLGANNSLQDSMRARTGTIRHMEVEALVSSSSISRRHGALQESLASVTYLSDIVPECKAVGLDIEATAQHEVAGVLWDQGESETSIRMRQHLIEHGNFDSQASDISLPVLLAKLGHHIAEARLAKPDTIMKDYLEPAIRELKGQTQGTSPGQVFHEFALFCDKQLQSPEAADDLDRIKTVMERKLQEHQEFLKLSTTDRSKTMRETYRRSANRAHTWYKLDNAEYERLRKAHEQFTRQCLENYLLSLHASDDFNNDALRVFSLWLEHSNDQLANDAVKLYLSKVPSGKFALLMNQLSSRLQAETTDFQKLLSGLVFRICVEHPYHGMHQIFAIQMKPGGSMSRDDHIRSKDESAKSRQRAATQIASMLGNDKRAQSYWSNIFQSNELYHALAMFKNAQDNQQGREIALDKYAESKAIVRRIPVMNIPPATLQIEIRVNCDYSDLPKINGFKPKMSIANGLSAPKVITAIGTDGRPYKQLFKSGNDDLRQDAIMEQVFDQVSRLLKNHTATRLRNLGIRTYKVLPLSTRSGLMEFVPNTMPLHQYIMPAHEKYYPSDWRGDRCRKEISNVQSDSLSTRVKVWNRVADNFHPVLRYFLLERFEDPDEWFERRLAYTRSTAAISILGHVLGLGDRHCHNILLDEKSGEVVHIDLGVSFEAGRVLPVPEVVPFRLTRDLVDGMGYTKTEGVFRRCCEFVLDTLREERESIMTLLNVLRYDPLVNWSVTPTKAKRMQENQDMGAGGNATRAGTTPAPTPGPGTSIAGLEDTLAGAEVNKKKEEQAGEAGRALAVVEKKLSKTLSTRATVRELIQAATDERNLAVLYCGWASYA